MEACRGGRAAGELPAVCLYLNSCFCDKFCACATVPCYIAADWERLVCRNEVSLLFLEKVAGTLAIFRNTPFRSPVYSGGMSNILAQLRTREASGDQGKILKEEILD